MSLTPTLPMVPEDEPQAGGQADGRRRREEAIRSGVLESLGLPGQLYRVAVMPLWRDHYRVNVLTGADATSARIAHSYFVAANDGGVIASSVPKITRQYP
jgi:hypothetical protein